MQKLPLFCIVYLVSAILAEETGVTIDKVSPGVYSLSANGKHVLEPGSVADMENMEILSILSEEITEIRPGAFQNLPKLTTLKIMFNNIPRIPTGMFTNASRLETLELVDNNISSIETHAFDDLKNLEIIDLTHNKLKFLDTHWFDQTHSLRTIRLSYNPINEIPANAFANLKYQGPIYITLSGHNITKIDRAAFQGLKTISSLTLNSSGWKTFKGDFLHHDVDIYILEIRDNKLEYVTTEDFEAAFKANITFLFLEILGNQSV